MPRTERIRTPETAGANQDQRGSEATSGTSTWCCPCQAAWGGPSSKVRRSPFSSLAWSSLLATNARTLPLNGDRADKEPLTTKKQHEEQRQSKEKVRKALGLEQEVPEVVEDELAAPARGAEGWVRVQGTGSLRAFPDAVPDNSQGEVTQGRRLEVSLGRR